jgi:hypothetical protein
MELAAPHGRSKMVRMSESRGGFHLIEHFRGERDL